MMFDISRRPTSNDSCITLTQSTCIINASASSLLGISEEFPCVRFVYDDEELRAGRKRLYICACPANTARAYKATKRNKQYRVYSTSLCQALKDDLGGQGIYRVDPEMHQHIDGRDYYEIFFRKFN